MKKEVLLTGGRGFLGSQISKTLKEHISIRDINEFFEHRVDISEPFFLPPDVKLDSVIHVAGKAHSVPKSEKEARDFFKVNFDGTKYLCEAIDKLDQKPTSFVFVSTVAVYGLEEGVDVGEDHPLNGETPYAKSKILAERYLIEWADANQIKLGIVRLPLIAGPNPPGNLGAMINGIKSGLYLSIGSADSRKSTVMADDVASVIPHLFEVGGVFNLTDGYHPSIGELEKAIATIANKALPIKIPLFIAKLLARLGDIWPSKTPINTNKLRKLTSTLTYSDHKAREILNWNPSKVLDRIDGLL